MWKLQKSGVIFLATIFVVCASPLNENNDPLQAKVDGNAGADADAEAALKSEYQKLIKTGEMTDVDIEKFRSVLNSGNFSENFTRGAFDPDKRQFWNFLPWPFGSLFATPAPQIVVPGPPAPPPIIFINLPGGSTTPSNSGPTTTTTTTTTTTPPSTEPTTTTPAPTNATTTTTTTPITPTTTQPIVATNPNNTTTTTPGPGTSPATGGPRRLF